MTKKNSQQIIDATLLAYLEGYVPLDVKAAIEVSPRLLTRAKQLAREEARLRMFLSSHEDEEYLE